MTVELARRADGDLAFPLDLPPLVIEITAKGAEVAGAKTEAAAAKSIPAAIAAARGSAEPPQTRVGFGQ